MRVQTPLNRFWWIRLFLVIIAVGSASALVISPEIAAQESEPKGFDLASDPDFRNYKEVVTEFAHKHRPRAENDFCIEAFITPDNLKSAWVVWHQGKEIILWEGGNDLDASRRTIHLKSDVVLTENDVHGSSYRVTRSWVDKITSTCDRRGVKVKVSKAKTFRR